MKCPKCGSYRISHYLDMQQTVKCEDCSWSKALNEKYFEGKL